jgi:hypothetical protein
MSLINKIDNLYNSIYNKTIVINIIIIKVYYFLFKTAEFITVLLISSLDFSFFTD